MPAYDPTLAKSLQALAARAIAPLRAVEVVPAPWSLINLITGTTAQGLFAVGSNQGTMQLVLALGAQWSSWLVAQAYSMPTTLSPLSGSFFAASGNPAGAQFDLTVSSLYGAMRANLQKALRQAVTQVPVVAKTELLVCGQGVGAALAQLAAFDLRGDNAAAGQKFAAVRCYTFSAPALANAALQQQFSQQLPDAWRVAASGTSAIDLFPSAPTAAQGFVGLGTPQTLNASLPSISGPWWERSGQFYANAYAAAPSESKAALRTVRRLPPAARVTTKLTAKLGAAASAYDSDMAVTMASLVAAVNQLAEHPSLSPTVPSPWTLQYVSDGGWCALFSSSYPKAYVLAFRTDISYAEAAGSLAVIGPYGPDYLPAGAVVHRGAATVYEAQRDALRTQLSKLDFQGANLYVTGHSLGGIVAQVAAGDLFCNALSNAAPTAITYCFGTPKAIGHSYASAVCPGGSCALRAQTYLVTRDRDTVAGIDWNGAATSFGEFVMLSGTTTFDDEAFHSLPSYVALLNPHAAP